MTPRCSSAEKAGKGEGGGDVLCEHENGARPGGGVCRKGSLFVRASVRRLKGRKRLCLHKTASGAARWSQNSCATVG